LAKYNIDDILHELGVEANKNAADSAPLRKHRVDEAEQSFANLPAVPANQSRPADPADPSGIIPPQHTPRSNIYSPEDDQPPRDLATLGREIGILPPDKLLQALNVVKQEPGKRLADALVELGADEPTVQALVAQESGVPFERIDIEKGFDGALVQRLTADFCKQKMIIPLRMEGMRVVVAATQADNVFLFQEVGGRLGHAVKVVLTPASDVKKALQIMGVTDQEQEQVDVSKILEGVEESDVTVEKKAVAEVDLEKEAGQHPVIQYVNYIIQSAVKEGASDIHIEPCEKKLKVRFRIDGELFEMKSPPASMSAAITSRLKIMANLDISERRIPQDGRIRCVVAGRKLDLRMSTLPNTYGEKTVMRILDTKSINVELENLGMHEDTYTIWKKQVDAPHGITLVTGPTGSGKTTTLYASLRQLDKETMNVCTVEDPVEYHLEGVTQTQMHEKIGMTFAIALRALLRQDPDVIMLGEIRDMETASIAVQAALTGHLVLSTLHTNDAPSSITRLVNIGLEPFLVGTAVNGVLAQRLIRRLCAVCKAQEKPSDEMAEYMQMHGFLDDLIWVAKACDKCRRTGFSGRVGIYELLAVDDSLRDIIARNPNVSEFRRLCIERGMVTLRQDGMRKVIAGVTTTQEVLRVTEAAH
jgi:type IV pilus assembly protein PilB